MHINGQTGITPFLGRFYQSKERAEVVAMAAKFPEIQKKLDEWRCLCLHIDELLENAFPCNQG